MSQNDRCCSLHRRMWKTVDQTNAHTSKVFVSIWASLSIFWETLPPKGFSGRVYICGTYFQSLGTPTTENTMKESTTTVWRLVSVTWGKQAEWRSDWKLVCLGGKVVSTAYQGWGWAGRHRARDFWLTITSTSFKMQMPYKTYNRWLKECKDASKEKHQIILWFHHEERCNNTIPLTHFLLLWSLHSKSSLLTRGLWIWIPLVDWLHKKAPVISLATIPLMKPAWKIDFTNISS